MSRRFDDLVALQQKLLSPGGCPWDREQTHDTLRTYLLEETYEVLDALDSGDPAKSSEELGDLLLQIVFHAELARAAGRFDIGDVIESIYLKMVRRHPHVFGDAQANSAADVLNKWEHLKAEERRQKQAASSPAPGAAADASTVEALLVDPDEGRAAPSAELAGEKASAERASLLDGIPKNLPALLQAYQITRRAARIGFDWDRIEAVLDKVAEEARELRETLSPPGRERPFREHQEEEEVGDLLFAAVNVARFLDLDPELALRKANQKFSARFRAMEKEAAESGRPLAKSSSQEMDALWEQSKKKVGGKS